jgi:phosphoribosylformylglycinamidine (FGAM) synthase-like amidotransferase family enzyme
MKRSVSMILLVVFLFINILVVIPNKTFAISPVDLLVNEDFENGDFAQTAFTAGYENNKSMLLNKNEQFKIITGEYSVYSQIPVVAGVWTEVLYSDTTKLIFEKGTTYKVSFNYKIIENSAEDGFCYFMAKSPTENDGVFGKGYNAWTGVAGDSGSKSFELTLGSTAPDEKDYRLVWGVNGGGGLSIDDIKIEKIVSELTSGFETGEDTTSCFVMSQGSVFSNPNSSKVITGNYSFYAKSKSQWEQMLSSIPGKMQLKPNTTYRYSFDYKIKTDPSTNTFFIIVRSDTGDYPLGVLFSQWDGVVGNKENKTFEFTTKNFNDYYILLGAQTGGEISFDSLILEEKQGDGSYTTVSNAGFETGALPAEYYNPSANCSIVYSNTNSIISGESSYYADVSTSGSVDCLYTNNLNFHLLPNTTYTISFNYKIERKAGSFYYFLVMDSTGWNTCSNQWNSTDSGSSSSKDFVFTTGNADSAWLVWGVKDGGAFSIDDIKISQKINVYDEGFEDGKFDKTKLLRGYLDDKSLIIGKDESNKIINGNYSVFTDRTHNVNEWTEVLYTDISKLILEQRVKYKVGFDYKILDTNSEGGFFYILTRGSDNTPLNLIKWSGIAESKGHKDYEIVLGDSTDYKFIWGTNGGGSISFDNITIKRISGSVADNISLNEDFESNNIDNTGYTLNYFDYSNGSLTSDKNKVISGKYSVYSNSYPDKEYAGFLMSKEGLLRSNTTYHVSFDYKILNSENKNSAFYFLARSHSAGNANDVGFNKVKAESGITGKKEYEFTTGNFVDYVLLLGVCNGAQMSVDNIKVTVVDSSIISTRKNLNEDFESNNIDNTGYTLNYFDYSKGSLTSDKNKVISGKYSVYSNSYPDKEYAGFLMSKEGLLKPNTSYLISFNYKILDSGNENGAFYFLARSHSSGSKNDAGFRRVIEEKGMAGKKEYEFTTGNFMDYVLLFGVCNGAQMSVDNIKVTVVDSSIISKRNNLNESFENGDIYKTGYILDYFGYSHGSLTSDTDKVVDGKYSAYSNSYPDKEYAGFLMSREGLLKPNTAYRVTFDYLMLDAGSAKGGSIYYLCRTHNGGNSHDKGLKRIREEKSIKGMKTIEFITDDFKDYVLVFGVCFGAQMSIDNITVEEISKDEVLQGQSATKKDMSIIVRPEFVSKLNSNVGSNLNMTKIIILCILTLILLVILVISLILVVKFKNTDKLKE